MNSASASATRARNLGVDVARGLGIALVFYGHFAEKLFHYGSAPALAQWKLVYAFHMPLFFFLAGVFWRPRDAAWPRWLQVKLRTRLLPVLSFSLLLLPLWAPRLAAADQWPEFLAAYLNGQPLLNWTTWFLVCLFMVEIWVALLERLTPLQRFDGAAIGAGMALLLGIACISVVGNLALATRGALSSWFVLEGVVAAPFYLLGLTCRRWVMQTPQARRDGMALLASGALLLATFGHNTALRPEPVVVMARMNHGDWFWFYGSATAGIAAAVAACRLWGPCLRPLAVVGRHSLVYLGLAGMSFSWIESGLVAAVGYAPTSHAHAALYTTGYVAFALIAWFPIAYALQRFAPQAFGIRRREQT